MAKHIFVTGGVEDGMATLIAVVWWHSGGFNLLVFIGLGIFWMVKHQMPYDLI